MRAFQRAGRGREALLEGWHGSGGTPGGPTGVGRPTQRAGRGREALLVDWEGSGALLEGLGIGGRFGGMGGVGRPSWRARMGPKAMLEGGRPFWRTGVVRRPSWRPEGCQRISQRARRGQETFLDGWEWSGDPPEAWQWSKGHPGGLGGVMRPFWRAGKIVRSSSRAMRGREALPEGGSLFRSAGMVQEALSVGWEGL